MQREREPPDRTWLREHRQDPDVTAVAPADRELTKATTNPVSARETRPLHRRCTAARGSSAGTGQAIWLMAAADAAVALLVSLTPMLPTQGRSPSAGLAILWLAALCACGCYSSTAVRRWSDQCRRLVVGGLALAALLPLVFVPERVDPWGSVAAAGILVVAALVVRQAPRTITSWRAPADDALRVVVSGHRRDVERIVAELEASRSPRYDVVAVRGAGTGSSTELQELSDVATRSSADAVLVAPCGHVGPADLRRLGWQLESSRTQLLLATSVLDVAPARTRLAHAGSLALVSVSHPRADRGRRWAKGVTDRILAAVGLILLAPVLFAVAVMICLDSPGSPIFRQTRTGKNGVTFTMFKFRSMRGNAEERRAELSTLLGDDSVLFKMRDDPRTTRVGHFLRRYSLDELPQLLNVLNGTMALVGPRPPLPEEVAQYHSDVLRRLIVRPGMTGLWQISGRSDLSWEEAVRLDLRYVDNWSPWLDIGILARTFGAVVHHRGAY